jgi:hypothetical protein
MLALMMQEEAMNQRMQTANTKLKKGKKTDSLPEPPEKTQSFPHLDLSTSDLQNCKIINLCYFEPSKFLFCFVFQCWGLNPGPCMY